VRSLLALLLLSALGSSAQPGGKWCATEDSGYKDVIASSIADLRWSLFALSMAADARQIPSQFLPRIADAAVISVANTLSLRANYLRTCDMEQKEYFRQLEDNEAFSSVLLHITSSEKFPALQLIREKEPTLVLSGDPLEVLAGKKVPLQGTITQRLDLVKRESMRKRTDPYFVAASQLLGEAYVNWNEREIQGVARIQTDPKGLLYRKSLKESLALIRGNDPVKLLEEVQHYFLRLDSAPVGVPASVAQGK
jgi:hypothetical protein